MTTSQPQLGISIDTRRNEAFIKADDSFDSFVYSAAQMGNVISLQLASKELMAIWKGGAPLTPGVYFEEKDQFAPAFIVADIRNDTAFPINVTNAYIYVTESTTDYHPYLVVPYHQQCSDGEFDPRIDFENFGWGDVVQSKLTYTFGAKSSRSRPFLSTLPKFSNQVAATVEGALKSAGADTSAMKRGNYKCISSAAVPSCFAKLKQSRIFGELANNVYVEGGSVLSDLSGTIDYSWLDSKGVTNKSQSPFNVLLTLGKFAVDQSECGGSGPIDRSEHAIILPLDRQQYRIPLNWHARMLSRQEQKFGLSLASLKSSHHIFRVVLQLSDGRSISSPVVDLTYFIPRMK